MPGLTYAGQRSSTSRGSALGLLQPSWRMMAFKPNSLRVAGSAGAAQGSTSPGPRGAPLLSPGGTSALAADAMLAGGKGGRDPSRQAPPSKPALEHQQELPPAWHEAGRAPPSLGRAWNCPVWPHSRHSQHSSSWSRSTFWATLPRLLPGEESVLAPSTLRASRAQAWQAAVAWLWGGGRSRLAQAELAVSRQKRHFPTGALLATHLKSPGPCCRGQAAQWPPA